MTRTNLTLICVTLLCALVTASGCGSRRAGREPGAAAGTYGDRHADAQNEEGGDQPLVAKEEDSRLVDEGYEPNQGQPPTTPYAQSPYESSANLDDAQPSHKAESAPAPRRSSGASSSDAVSSAPRGRPLSSTPSMPPKRTRPGLGTSFGENRASYVTTAEFYRGDPNSPSSLLSIYYNDEAGVRAQTSSSYPIDFGDNLSEAAGGLIAVQLVDMSGDPYRGIHAGGHDYVIGRDGEYYSIVVRNRSSERFEIVATVDGLDVIDGRPGSYSKRGYLLSPWSTVEIDGFRRSDSTVAGFRFGSVSESYAARTGRGRNVGIIGVAVFRERGLPPPAWNYDEVERRRRADPFPGRYASPPPFLER